MKTLGQILYETGNLVYHQDAGDYDAEPEEFHAAHELAAAAVVAEYERRKKEAAPEIINRAVEMLRVAAKYCLLNPEDTILYDDARCDGACVAVDCESAADMLEAITHFRALPAPPEVQS